MWQDEPVDESLGKVAAVQDEDVFIGFDEVS
jgi:hypothetical protein